MSYQISRRKFHQNLRRIHQNLRSWSQKSDQEFWFLKQKFPFVDTKFEHTSLRQARGKRRPQAVARACPRRVCSTRSCDSFNTQFLRARKKREKNSRRAKRGKNSRRASQKFYSLSIFSTHLIQDSTSGVTQQDGGHVGVIYQMRERGREGESSQRQHLCQKFSKVRSCKRDLSFQGAQSSLLLQSFLTDILKRLLRMSDSHVMVSGFM